MAFSILYLTFIFKVTPCQPTTSAIKLTILLFFLATSGACREIDIFFIFVFLFSFLAISLLTLSAQSIYVSWVWELALATCNYKTINK